jgi:putative tryptophan/tyrosine transport system substrate-binding protein
MRRRDVILGLGAAVVWPRPAHPQQRIKIPLIGYLSPGSRDNPQGRSNMAAFRQGLTDLGYIEGQTIRIEYRFAEGNFELLPGFAADLVRLNVATIVAGPTPAAVAAWIVTRTTPIVMINVDDPVRLGLVASLARPGGNVTGLAFTVGTDTLSKGLELLKSAVPGLHRVAILFNPDNLAHVVVLRELQIVARTLSLELRPSAVRGPDDFDRAFSLMAEQGIDGVYLIPDVLFVSQAARLVELAAKHRLPSLHQSREEVEAGGLMSYGHNSVAAWRQAAKFVDQLVKGASPSDLPVQLPTQFEFVINLKTAKELGLTIPPMLLVQADELFE